MNRGGPLRQQSAKRISERPDRQAVVGRAISAEGGRCALWWLADIDPNAPCRGELVGHEIAHRSVYPGSHLIDGLVVALCVGHNGWEDVQTNEVAEAAGVRCPASAVDRFGVPAIDAECRRVRRARSQGRDPGPLLWHRDDDPDPPDDAGMAEALAAIDEAAATPPDPF